MRRRGRSWPTRLFLLALFGAGIAAAVWYFRPDLRPGWVPDALPTSPAATVTMYRWKDDGGQWVISDTPPTDERPYEEVTLRTDTNTLPGMDQ